MDQRQYILDLVRRELTDTQQPTNLNQLTARLDDLESAFSQLGQLLLGSNDSTAEEISELKLLMKRALYYSQAKKAIGAFILSIPKYPLYSYYSRDDIDDYHLAVVNRKPILPQFRYIGLIFGKQATGSIDFSFDICFNLSKPEINLLSTLAPTGSMVVEDMRRESSLMIKCVGKFLKLTNTYELTILVVTGTKLIYSQLFKIPGHRIVSFEFMLIANSVHTTVNEPSLTPALPIVNGDIICEQYHFEIRAQDLSLQPAPAYHARTIQSLKRTWKNADMTTSQFLDRDVIFEPSITGADHIALSHVYALAESSEIITISGVNESQAGFESMCRCFSVKSGSEMAARMMMLALEVMSDREGQSGVLYSDGAISSPEPFGILAGITEGLLANAKAIALLVKHAILSEEINVNLTSIEQTFSRLIPFVPKRLKFTYEEAHVHSYSVDPKKESWNPIQMSGIEEKMFEKGRTSKTLKTSVDATWNISDALTVADCTIRCFESDDIVILLKPSFNYGADDQIIGRYEGLFPNNKASYLIDAKSSYAEDTSHGYTTLFISGLEAKQPCAEFAIPRDRSVKLVSVKMMILSKKSVLPISGENLFGEIDMYIGRTRGTVNCNKFSPTEYIDESGYKRYGLTGVCNGGSLLNALLTPFWIRAFCGGYRDTDQVAFTGFSRSWLGDLSGQSKEVFPMPGSVNTTGSISQVGTLTKIYGEMERLNVTFHLRTEANSMTPSVFGTSEIPAAALSTEIRDYIRQQSLFYPNAKLREEEALLQGAVVMRAHLRGKLYITKGSESIPESVYVWNTQLNDLAVAVKMTADLANAAEIRSRENAFRISEMEQAIREIETQLVLSGIADGLAALAGPATPVVRKAATIMFGTLRNMSRSGFRILSAGLTNSQFKSVMSHFLGTQRGIDVWKGLGIACAESSVMVKLSGKSKPIVKEGSSDLFLIDKNFILADPIEFAKHNISTRYGGKLDKIGQNTADSERLPVGGDVGSHVVTVFHRPLNILPEPIRTILFKLSTSGMNRKDLAAREAWIRQTLHPTHSYATISYDYVLPKTGGNRRVICFAGVGDPNPYNLPTGDKNVGIGSYVMEFDILGLDKDTGVKIMRPVHWKECGYTEDRVWSIYSTLGKEYRKTEAIPYTVDDAWQVIARSSHKRMVTDKAIVSTPISYERQRAVEYMLSSNGFDYNLVLNNCQDFTRGLFDYARGGPVPEFIENEVRIAMLKSTSRHFSEVCSWGGA